VRRRDTESRFRSTYHTENRSEYQQMFHDQEDLKRESPPISERIGGKGVIGKPNRCRTEMVLNTLVRAKKEGLVFLGKGLTEDNLTQLRKPPRRSRAASLGTNQNRRFPKKKKIAQKERRR